MYMYTGFPQKFEEVREKYPAAFPAELIPKM